MSLSHPSGRRLLARAALVGTVLAGLLATGVGIASAHVEVSSTDASAGGFGTVVFTVPNESDTANTTRVRIQIPAKTPLASVAVEAVPGWTVTTTTENLATPLTTDDGDKVTSAVSVVDFAAAAGGGIPPGQFQEFKLSGGPFPKQKSMSFSTIQTYSDGTEVAWIEPSVEGQPEPQHPAPTLTLTSSSSDSTPVASDGSSSTASSDSGSGRDGLTLFLAILALVVALAAAALAWRAGRRTVSS